MFNSMHLTFSSDVDQYTYGKVTKTTHKRAKRSVFSKQVTTKLQGTDKTAKQRQK